MADDLAESSCCNKKYVFSKNLLDIFEKRCIIIHAS